MQFMTFVLTTSLIHSSTELPTTKHQQLKWEGRREIKDGDNWEKAMAEYHTMTSTGLPNHTHTVSLRNFCLHINLTLRNCSCISTPELCTIQQIIRDMQHDMDVGSYARDKSFTLAYATETVFVSALGTIGNALVLIFYLKQRCKLSSCKFHIAQLAVVNLTFSLIQLANTVPLYWTNTWIYGLPLCKVIRTLIEMGSCLTVVFILLIAVERYVLIVHPLITERESILSVEGRAKHITVVVGMLLVTATVSPFWMGMGIEEGSERCVMFVGDTRGMALPYNWFAVIAYCVLPACVMSYTYGRIITSHSKMSLFVEGRARMRKLKENKRIVRITVSILGLFLVCTLPSRILSIYIYMEDRFRATGNPAEEGVTNRTEEEGTWLDMRLYLSLQFVAYVTFPLQCTLNPLLYSMVDNEWRKCMREGTRFCQYKSGGGCGGGGGGGGDGGGGGEKDIDQEIFTITRTQSTKRVAVMQEVS